MSWSRNPEVQAPRFGLTRFRSPLLARSRLLSFPQGTEMFHFPWSSPSGTIEFIPGCHGSRHGGLPHSEISGSMPVDGSPELIAVCRVLLRLVMPRHPSCARIRLAGRNPASRLRCSLLYLHVSMLPVVKDLKMVPRALSGGDGRTRTGDILLAKQALYQLSYAPETANRS